MPETKIYTYEDWKTGKVALTYCNIEFHPDEVTPPLFVSWDNFEQKEKRKIQKHQEHIFKHALNKQIEIHTVDFINKYTDSKSTSELTASTLRSLNAIYTGAYRYEVGIYSSPINHDHKMFDDWYYSDMMEYKRLYFIEGLKPNYDNVPCLHYDENKISPSIKISLIKYMIGWITAYDLKHNPSNKEERKLYLNAEEEPLKPGWDIFSSPQARDLFLDLESKVVVKVEYEAGYSLIFHTMQDSKKGYPIKKNVKQSTYCDFVHEHRDQPPIHPPKLKKVNPMRKKHLVEECLKTYFNAISSYTEPNKEE